MPPALKTLVQIFPSTHYIDCAQAILYRGAAFNIVWRSFAIVAAMGLVFFAVALIRFRRTVA
jgi:ABC-2 type transport system permease protein